ncbi:hypothetical protein [Pseudomonas aeruginosa]|uniref:hypothetical protein n=1 Tax=Pseudomonas aeruginosa TaxID=287 RepID=UPI00187D3DD6|nr:hypothetical protein [Pseudomonas aeruginosa]
MTDHAELRRLAEEVIRIERSEDEPISSAWELFDSAANPKTILAMLDEIDGCLLSMAAIAPNLGRSAKHAMMLGKSGTGSRRRTKGCSTNYPHAPSIQADVGIGARPPSVEPKSATG